MRKMPEDIIILHKCTINDNHKMHCSWDIKHNRQNFFVILGHFLPFYALNNPEIKILKKRKKKPGDIILHKCTINGNHMMYGSWGMKCNRQNFLLFWAIFCPFTQLATQKIQILKKWKYAWRYHHFTQGQ